MDSECFQFCNFFSVLSSQEEQHLNAVIWHLFLHLDLLMSEDLTNLINRYQIANAAVLADGAGGAAGAADGAGGGAAVPAADEAGGAVGPGGHDAGGAGDAGEDTGSSGHHTHNGHAEGDDNGDISPRPRDE